MPPDASPIPGPTLTCPQCHARVESTDTHCPNCHVNLALAAALVERQYLASTPAPPSTPYLADLILPRFGEFLLENRYITDDQLQAALATQRARAAQGKSQTVGQILLEMGVVTREQLDLSSIQQVRQLQNSLQAQNRQLEQRVAERTRELQQAFRKLSELNLLKANFVLNISHDLRTPLMDLKGYVGLLADEEPLSEDQLDLVKKTELAVAQLESQLSNLLHFAASARGEMTLNLAPFALPNLADRVLNASLPKAAKAGLELHSGVPDGLPQVMGDQEKIRWALFQLLDNAVKFTPAPGHVTLAAEALPDRVRVSVRDTGIGIAPERQAELFTPFHLLHDAGEQRPSGAGLGLALVKRIIEAHDSRVDVESAPGRGSSFSFDLPIAPLRGD
jgi:signal transduction histidine kinase